MRKEVLGQRGEKGTASILSYCTVPYRTVLSCMGYGSSSFFSLGEGALRCLHLPDWGPWGVVRGARRPCLSGPFQLSQSQLGSSEEKGSSA